MEDFDSDMDSLSSDEELLLLLENHQEAVVRNKNYIEVIVPQYSDEMFVEHFRVSRNVYHQLEEKFTESPYFNAEASGGNGKLTASYFVLVFLWFCGHQTASFRDVSDRFDISLSSLHRIIGKMTDFLSEMASNVIKWPNLTEKQEIELYFRVRGFPGVIGAIDGTHIKIDKPTEDPDSYLNRKHFFSIQMQVVCDHQKKIRDIFIGYPGSVHDSRVYRMSPLSDELAEKCGNDYFILGDSGYPCTSHLLTPYRNRGQLNQIQTNYNRLLAANRYIIEHCFGLLKQKFRQLYHLKLRDVNQICHFIRACCVLHNLAINDVLDIEEIEDDVLDNDDHPNNRVDDDRDGMDRRNHIAQMLM